MLYFFAYSAMRSVVGPGTVSADSYQALSWPGQKYAVLKISCTQRICTPCSPADSVYGVCYCTIASLLSSGVPYPSVFGKLICIKPDLIILAINKVYSFLFICLNFPDTLISGAKVSKTLLLQVFFTVAGY